MNINFNSRRFLDPDPKPTPGPSLSDLDNPPPAPAPPELKLPPPGDPPPAADTVEGLNPDGTLQEGYIKNEQGEIVKEPAADEEDDTDGKKEPVEGVTPEEFWDTVNKLRGDEIKVELPADMDPLSPEAVVIREKAVADVAVNTFVEYLQKADPRGYAYLLHRQAGGSDDDFFSEKTFSLPDYEEFKSNKDLQERLYLSSLTAKGLKPEQARTLVDQAIKEDKLFALADEEYRHADTAHQKSLEAIKQKQEQVEQQYLHSVAAYDKSINDTVEKGMRFIVPESDRTAFMNFVREHTEYNNETGSFMLVHNVSKDELSSQLEAMYLLYKKGDLSKLIERKAKAVTSARLGAKVKKDNTGSNHGGTNDTPPGQPTNVPLGFL